MWWRLTTPLQIKRQEFTVTLFQRSDGVVIVIPGRKLNGIMSFTSSEFPSLLEEGEIERIVVMSRVKSVHIGESSWMYTSWRDFVQNNFMKVWLRVKVCSEASNMNIRGNLNQVPAVTGIFLLVLLSVMYGGIHATSWNGHFPSLTEQKLWRVAVCVVAGGGVIIWWGAYAMNLLAILNAATLLEIKGVEPVRVVLLILYSVIFLIFCSSRLFLVTEAFISIRSLPVGAYSTVNWVTFLPHIG